MAGFDVNAARQAGYSDDEIIAHLTQTRNFDVQGAQRAGYSSAEIVDHLASTPAMPNAGLAGPARPNVNMQQSPFGRIDSSDPSQLQFGGMHGGSYDIMPQAGARRYSPNSPEMAAAAAAGTGGAALGAGGTAVLSSPQVSSILAPIAKKFGIKALEGAGLGTGYELYRQLKKVFEPELK